MGTIFEELIRKFSETSNEEAGEHFTPRDVINLMTEIMFINDESIKEKGIIKTIYDPACGTGGMLTSLTSEEYGRAFAKALGLGLGAVLLGHVLLLPHELAGVAAHISPKS